MSGVGVSLQRIIDDLREEGLISANEDYSAYLEKLPEKQPWYIRMMVGFGAWLASLLLIGFVAGIGSMTDRGFAMVGAVFVIGAVFTRRNSENDFLVQGALACSLAGQALFAYGIAELSGFGEVEDLLVVIVALNLVLFFLFPDYTHRVLSILIAMSSIAVLLYLWELNALIPLMGPLSAAAMIAVYRQQGIFIGPLTTGLMLTSFGFLLLSSVYILPELGADFAFYPRPWLSTLALCALLIYLGTQVRPHILVDSGASSNSIYYALLLVISVAAWAIPGLLLALIVIILGASSGNRLFLGFGIAFLIVFIAAYFYGIQVSMLTKSIALVSTGVAVLLARWLLLRVTPDHSCKGSNHVC